MHAREDQKKNRPVAKCSWAYLKWLILAWLRCIMGSNSSIIALDSRLSILHWHILYISQLSILDSIFIWHLYRKYYVYALSSIISRFLIYFFCLSTIHYITFFCFLLPRINWFAKMSGGKVDIKVVLLGKSYAGKTTLVNRFISNRFLGDTVPYQNVIEK